MNTDDLIAALAVDTAPRPAVARLTAGAILAAFAVSAGVFVIGWGPRPDLGAALASLALAKTLGPMAVALFALAVALALAHPAAPGGRRQAALGAALGLALVVFLGALIQGGVAGLIAALSTPSLFTCLVSIPFLALPLLAAVLWGLSSGAPLRPRLTGALAGLTAGAGAAALYSLYCDKDMALFVLPAYSTAIAVVALAGAALGPRALRW